MYTRFMKTLCGVSVVLFLLVAFSGCVVVNGPTPPTPSYGSVRICSDSTNVYGVVYLDGTSEGTVSPEGCITVHNVQLDRNYRVEIDSDWDTFTKDFYFSHDGQTVYVSN